MPLDSWHGPYTDPRRAAGYKAQWSTVLRDLVNEVANIGGDEVVVLLQGLSRLDLRQDGFPKSGVKVPDPVVVHLPTSEHGPLRFQSDRWWGWQDNVRAVGLTLTRLRLVAEAGVAQSGQQYQGWAQLPPGSIPLTAGGTAMTVDEAAKFIVSHCDDPVGRLADIADDPYFALVLYKEAARRLHPDKGGDTDDFQQLGQAKALLLAARPTRVA